MEIVMRWHSLVAILSFSPAALQAQDLDSIVRALLTDLPLASASVAILRGGDTLAWTAQGYADLENRVAATPSTVYHIGSITKQFTAAAILQQVEGGIIGLDDDIAKYIPDYSNQGKHVTVRQLLNHTSGIRNLSDLGDPFFRTLTLDIPQKDVLALIRDQPFEFEPGTRWSYSNIGYYLLGVILERVTGKTYADYIAERVVRPAGLIATSYCDTRALIPHRARGYDAVGVDFINAQYMSMTIPFSAVALCSTAGDLVTWARALRSGKVISRRSYQLMTTPVGAAAHASPPYGFGVWVIESGGKRYISHLGVLSGFNAVLSDVPSDSLTIAVLTNTSGMGASTLGGRLGAAIRGVPPPVTEKAARLRLPPSRPLTDVERRLYSGRYEVREVRDDGTRGPGVVTLQVFSENGRLTALLTGDPPEALTPAGEHQFVATARPDKRFTFAVRDGLVTGVTFVGPDGTYEGARTSRH
jgi:CubicO group peptidase (beta-lactamase class C family)